MYRETVLSAARFSNLSSDMLRPLMLQTRRPRSLTNLGFQERPGVAGLHLIQVLGGSMA